MSRTFSARVRSAAFGFLFVAPTIFYFLSLPIAPNLALATTCDFGSPTSSGECQGFLTSGSQWTVPSDWNDSTNTIEIIGGGGGGGSGDGQTGSGGGGGGGGAYAEVSDVTLTSGSDIPYQIGAGGVSAAPGTDTVFGSNATACGGSPAPIVCAAHGEAGATDGGSGGSGGSASNSIGQITYSGGAGGSVPTYYDGAGGGGAAGPHGNGGSGGIGSYGHAGGGGGGGGGGTNGQDAPGGDQLNGCTGGNGGNNWQGAGGAVVSGPSQSVPTPDCGSEPVSGQSGTDGGGGAGGNWIAGQAGTGGNGEEWDATHGSGGGAGGASGGNNFSSSADGGLYGGGGGGAGWSGPSFGYAAGGSGAPGIIVITYYPLSVCSDTLLCDQTCLDGSQPVNGQCPLNPSGQCSLGYALINNQCLLDCPAGDLYENNECVASCDTGYTQQGDQCIQNSTNCPIGYAEEENQCVFSGCPQGYTEGTDTNSNPDCVQTACSAGYICDGGSLYYQNSSCIVSANPTETCPYGCSGGACLPPPAPEIASWSVKPILVQSGQTTTIQWQAENVVSCMITGTNGDTWTGLAGDETSSPITGQTTYDILCQGFPGASPATASTSTIVNIAPTYNEI